MLQSQGNVRECLNTWKIGPQVGVLVYVVNAMCQVNQSLFWSYYYSTLAVVILLLLIKSNARNIDDNFDSFQVSNMPFLEVQETS